MGSFDIIVATDFHWTEFYTFSSICFHSWIIKTSAVIFIQVWSFAPKRWKSWNLIQILFHPLRPELMPFSPSNFWDFFFFLSNFFLHRFSTSPWQISLYSSSLGLKVWSLNQQHQHHWRTCSRWKFSGPNPDVLHQKV